MYRLGNNVLGQLKAGIAGADVSLVVKPLAGVPPFILPPDPTNSAGGTYGAPYGIITLIDKLDSSATKIEHILYTSKVAEAGGAFTYSGLLRAQEGTAAQNWAADVYVLQMPTALVLGDDMQRAVLRSNLTVAHTRDAVLAWDGVNFKFSSFRVVAVGRGKHFSVDGVVLITMPAVAQAVNGFGGAANTAVVAGGIPIAEGLSLWYEPNIAGSFNSIAGNFKLVGTSADFIVPAHWIFIAAHTTVGVAGEKCLRIANGETLYPLRVVGAAGEPAFTNGWGNLGGGNSTCAFVKSGDGWVSLQGVISAGGIGNAAFTLPAGYRPSLLRAFAVPSNGAFGQVIIQNTGTVTPNVGNNASVWLEGIRFPAEA